MPNPLVLGIGSTALSAFGSISAGKSAKKQANFEAAATREQAFRQAGFIEEEARAQAGFIEEESAAQAGFIEEQSAAQALIEEQRAQREREIAVAEESDFRRSQSRNLAERRAALGGAGVRLDTGSPVLAMGDFVAEAEIQARRIRAGGAMDALRLEQQANLLRATGTKQGSLLRTYGKKQAELIRTSGITEAELTRTAGSTEASLLRSAGSAAARRGYFRAGSQILSGVAGFI